MADPRDEERARLHVGRHERQYYHEAWVADLISLLAEVREEARREALLQPGELEAKLASTQRIHRSDEWVWGLLAQARREAFRDPKALFAAYRNDAAFHYLADTLVSERLESVRELIRREEREACEGIVRDVWCECVTLRGGRCYEALEGHTNEILRRLRERGEQ